MYPIPTVRESQPDWLTVGAHSTRAVTGLRDLARTIRDQERTDGNQERPWHLLAYEGYRCGRVRYGESRGWAIAQLSGDTASTYLEAAIDTSESVSRLDLAVTVQTPQSDPDLGARAYQEASAWRVDHPRASKVWHIAGDDGAYTLYLGARSSDLFFRLYNKQAESEAANDPADVVQYANSWRYELECKGETAQATAERLLRTVDIPRATMALVGAYAQGHGVTPSWAPDADVKPIGTFRRRSDRERKLDWLTKSVAPTVRWLLDNGDREAALSALGLILTD